MSFRTRRNHSYEESLNLTPMIDILMLIIFFFMMGTTAKVYDYVADLKLPVSGVAGTRAPDKQVPKVTMTKDGALFLDNQPVTQQELEAGLAKLKAEKGIEQVVLQSDAEVTLQQLVTVTDACRAAGIRQVSPRILGPSPSRTPAQPPR